MKIRHRVWGVLLFCGLSGLALANDVKRPAQADPPEDFEGSVQERLAKHSQNLAAIRYRVAVQLECVAKEDDLGAALGKCIRFVDESTNETEPDSANYIRLLALEEDVKRELDEARKAKALVGEDNESSEAGIAAVSIKDVQKLRYEQLKAGYVGINKLLKTLKVPLTRAATIWKAGGAEIRQTMAKNLDQRYKDWCAWNAQ
jgi:hypothetical protein